MQGDENKSHRTSRRVQKKIDARRILLSGDQDQFTAWVKSERNALEVLTALLFEEDAFFRFRAIEHIGIAARILWAGYPERIRRQVRRFLWMMNDESGALCWHAPEAIGEIMVNVPVLADEYGNMLISFYNEEPFEAGVRSALTRLVEKGLMNGQLRERMESIKNNIIESLESGDAAIRGSSLILLKSIGIEIPQRFLQRLKSDDGKIYVYDFESGSLSAPMIKELL
jgi:hypothetical protein